MPEPKGDKPKLIAVQVPWQVSPTTPYLRLRTSESDDDWPTEVAFLGYFGPVALPDWEPGQPGTGSGTAYQHLRIVFEQGLWTCLSPGIHDGDPIDRARYDEAALPGFRDSGPTPEAYIKAFWERWRSTGLCPDPGMYEVAQSTWMQAVGAAERMQALGYAREDYKHYIIEAHDSYVEVIAKAWRYESLGPE
jgi:hypothetical protein